MQCYTDLIGPTAVTHALSLKFLSHDAINLVVARVSLLQVFEVAAGDPQKLILVGEYPLSGTVTSLAPVKTITSRTGGDALLIAFRDAKLSLVEWDPENHRISTVSIHYYEGENIISQPFGPSLEDCASILTVDPSSRCAAYKFGPRQLAIIPFRQSGDDLVEGSEDGLDVDMDSQAVSKDVLSKTKADEGKEADKETPYRASFVLPLTALDPSLTQPIDMAFLHGYREPTFGILSAPVYTSSALLSSEVRRDCLTLLLFTLDLEQRASTNLAAVPRLPSDLWKVIPLGSPVGGALLVGTNELVHVDQSGKTSAVAVNEFAKQTSDFSMIDSSELNMKLEGCEITTLDERTGDLLIVLNDASMVVLSFQMSGRTVSSLDLSRVSLERGGDLVKGSPSGLATVGEGTVFAGSSSGDSALLSWVNDVPRLSRKRSHAQMLDQAAEEADDVEDDLDDLDDDDDLYAPSAEPARRTTSFAQASGGKVEYTFQVQDTLSSLAPVNQICVGATSDSNADKLSLVAGVGRESASRLAFISRGIRPRVVQSSRFEGARGVWGVQIRNAEPHDGEDTAGTSSVICVYDGDATKVYDVTSDSDKDDPSQQSTSYTERTGTEFETEGETLFVTALDHGKKVAQCRTHEIRIYDSALGLTQIIPQVDEETDAELGIIATSIHDPCILVLRDDSSIQILEVTKDGDVEPLDLEGPLLEKQWLSGSIYCGKMTGDRPAAFLLRQDGALLVHSLPDVQQIFFGSTLPFLPPVLSSDAPLKRGGKVTLTEILAADIGPVDHTQPLLVVRTALDDVVLYEPFLHDATNPSIAQPPSRLSSLRFRKVPNTYLPKYQEVMEGDEGSRPTAIRAVAFDGHRAIVFPGASPTLIMKETSSLPKFMPLDTKDIVSFTTLDAADSQGSLALFNRTGDLQQCLLPMDMSFGTGWCVQKLALGDPPQEIRQIAYFAFRGVYVVATCRSVDFYFSKDELRHTAQDEITMRPQIPQYTIYLLSATSHQVIDAYEMEYQDLVTSLKVMPLEISEQTHRQKPMIVIGSASMRGEDMPAKGAVTILEVIDVVPDPDRAESGIKLNVFSREETRGAVTAVEPFAHGFVGTGQGQKIMIRGLREDGSCLPVAFLDAQCHTTQLKTLGSSGLWLAGDAWKGLWFGGFTEEPYRLSVLAKPHRTKMQVTTADFLPFDDQLFIVLTDGHNDLQIHQYDPENPRSMSGVRLLHRAAFHLGGHYPTTMTLLPSTLAPFTEQQPSLPTNGHTDPDSNSSTPPPDALASPPRLQQLLLTSHSGTLSLLTPLDERTYRRLSSVQTQLTSILEHAAGLNPRAYRTPKDISSLDGAGAGSGGAAGIGSRAGGAGGGAAGGVVDGTLVQRISELGAARRAEVLARAGADAWTLRSDLEIVGGGGLSYL